MTRLVVEKILGLQREGNSLRIEPCIPEAWREYEIDYRFGKTMYHLLVKNPQNANNGLTKLTLDGKLLEDEIIVLEDDGREHKVVVTLGGQVQSTRPKETDARREK
jgi:cellobiose phosphorylase